MKPLINYFGICILLFQIFALPSSAQINEKRERSFNSDWKFIKDTLSGAENPAFDDSGWRTVDLPHDFAIEDIPGSPGENQIGPFYKDAQGKHTVGYIQGGTGWYRKHFTIDPKDNGKTIHVLFDGVMMASDVWINGKHLGFHPYGYSPFAYDLTPWLNPAGQTNVIAVKAKNNIGETSRWYSGAGIYRNVSLIVTNPLHIDIWGVYVNTPEVTKEKVTMNLTVQITNDCKKDTKIMIETHLVGPDGKVVAIAEGTEKIGAKENKGINQSIIIDNPRLWSPEAPNLYEVWVNIFSRREFADAYSLKTGIRTIKYDTENGLQINDQPVKLKGGSVHHDNGILGAAAFSRAEERKVEIMKENGFNAIRTSHNPVSAQFLEACDRLGMLVIEEAFDVWTKPKTPGDYHMFFKDYWQKDLESMLLRDRNHPCIIMWSTGNETPERGDSTGLEITRQIISEIRRYDSTRPITEGVNPWLWETPRHKWDYSAPIFELLDIAGYNYNWHEWEKDHQKYPGRLVMTTESYPLEMYTVWTKVEKYPWVLGDFVWTGMDYFGEAGVGTSGLDDETNFMVKFGDFVALRTWPWFNAWCGDIDIIGNKKPQSYYRDVVWNRSRMEIAVHSPVPEGRKELISKWGWPDEWISWTWPGEEGKELEVTVYSRCTSVILELNGKIIGEETVENDPEAMVKPLSGSMSGPVPVTQLAARFSVPYEAGELKAIGLENGKEVVTKVLETTGEPRKLILTPDRTVIRADRNDLTFITVEVADEKGNIIPNATLPVEFEISGTGELTAAGNGSPDQMESFRDNKCKIFHGKAMIIVRPFDEPGKITVTARSKGLVSGTVDINVVD